MSSFDVDIKKLLEAGAHFGHKTSRWHPKMNQYIHSKRGGSHIIDLVKTVENLEVALEFIKTTAASGKQVLIVSTKPQARNLIKETAEATNMPFVCERWLGGMLTNQNTIGKRIKYLKDIEVRMANGELAAKYNKLEVQRFAEEIEEMNHVYGGIKEMHARPGAVVVIDVVSDINAVREAKKLNIPVVALVDTNADPTLVDYPIPSNDDAIKTISLMLDYIKAAITEGKGKLKAEKTDDKPTEKPHLPSKAVGEEPKTAEAKAPAKEEPKKSTKTTTKKEK